MRNKWSSLLLFPFLLFAEERDPFQPAIDLCRTTQLNQWRYGGAIGDSLVLTGILQDSDGKWRRVKVDETLSTNWRITLLTTEKIVIVTGPGCEPAQWVWQRKGRKNDEMDKSAVSAVAGNRHRGQKRSSRVADRR
ncbi:HofP DNA utilization family protein [Klebsiella sp. 2680]|uniref:HofP DNA utilization family protein n=1 Tax=Klebsiella sp. 2680 TaxID=2018037 RepID=UPI0011581C82|nr:HofP DNA utilization family protein [Klebsiella sp. 2680]